MSRNGSPDTDSSDDDDSRDNRPTSHQSNRNNSNNNNTNHNRNESSNQRQQQQRSQNQSSRPSSQQQNDNRNSHSSNNSNTNNNRQQASSSSNNSRNSNNNNNSNADKSNTNNNNTNKNINELLRHSLQEASQPGEGDEEPIVLEAPGNGLSEVETNGRTRNISPSNNKNSDGDDSSSNSNRMQCDDDEDNIEDEKSRAATKIRELKQQAIEAEERKVAEMTFDHEALLPITDRMEERAKYIPLRLTYEERKELRLVNATITVSNYTNAVDLPFKSKAKRHHAQLQAIVSFLSGLIAAQDYSNGQEIVSDRNFAPYEGILQNMLEISRRYKITNPEKMRSEYGKLVYLMQDADGVEIKSLLGIQINKPIKTVYEILKLKKGLAILEDHRIATATEEILPQKDKSRHAIQLEIKRKERAADSIVRAYTPHLLSEDIIRQCLYSISDNNSFLNSNLKPIEDCIELLKYYFHPKKYEPNYSLSINEGADGARLTHSHENQFNYVLQSLTLWASIVEDMFRLWYLAELDLLSSSSSSPSLSSESNTSSGSSSESAAVSSSGTGESMPYELRNTGQGLQRVKESPRVYRAMHEILARTKHKLGGWVGSSVIHLGDNNVPNPLMFIDKYTQIPRILGPLVKTLDNLEAACVNDEGLRRYMDAYGGIDKAKKTILHDFFTHAFDGSGGDNFFDAGSCIDGRLTSAWHWCSQLASKPYYPLFRLTGFLSFDGQFDN